MHVIRHLYDLQELDSRLSAFEKSLVEVRAKLADDSALSSAREQTSRLEERLLVLTFKRRGLDRTTAELQERLQKVESRLYGGVVTSPRELAAAEEERNFVERQRQEEEDRLLDIMIELEDVQSASHEAQETLARLKAEEPARKEGLLKTEEHLVAELASIGQDRDRIAPLIPAELLSLYETLRKGRDGHAVVRVERGRCNGCRVALSIMEIQRARGSQGVVQCSSCRRILYVV